MHMIGCSVRCHDACEVFSPRRIKSKGQGFFGMLRMRGIKRIDPVLMNHHQSRVVSD